MCEFCTKHGEGKKWYLNVKNYSNDLLSDTRRKEFSKNFFYWVEHVYKKHFDFLKKLPLNMPIIGPSIKAIVKHIFIQEHWGQIIPIEDVAEIVSMANSIVRIPCVCRKVSAGKTVRTCFGITINPEAIGLVDMVDQSFFGGPALAQFEKMDKQGALAFMKEQEQYGMFHSIWTFESPFIGGICNCDNKGCIAFKMYSEVAPIFFKGEYTVRFNVDRCVSGCKSCVAICPFGALRHDVTSNKVKINVERCYGCGICRSVCKENAPELVSKKILTH
jgi:Fe-S-cluster-containing hydrogenase component 2